MFRSSLLVLCVLALPAFGQELPLLEDAEWEPFRRQALRVIQGMEKLGQPLPAEVVRSVKALLVERPADARHAIRDVQKVLDPHCLVGVSINPESRVKVARGPLRAGLRRDRPAFMLVKVHNEAGVTHPLVVSSDQTILQGKPAPDRWVEAAIVHDAPFANRLSGWRIEYRVLRVTARQSGKREATLAFDVGQGTQDLGYRAETPILFTIRDR